MTWSRIHELCCEPRAYHTATFLTVGGIDSIVYVGGCFKKRQCIERISLPENVPNTGISYHSSLNVGPCNFIVGGNSDESLNGTHNIHTVKTSTKRPEIHVCVTYLPFDFPVAQYSQMEVK